MGSVANIARTRVVLSRQRASTRASTEPRFARGTNPPEVSDEPYLKMEITGPSDVPLAEGTGKSPRYVRTVSRKSAPVLEPPPASRDSAPELEPHLVVRGIADGEIETNPVAPRLGEIETNPVAPRLGEIETNPVAPQLGEIETNELPRVSTAEIEESTREVERVLDTFVEPSLPKKRASTDSAKLMWLGVVLSQPEVGAALVIGTWMRSDFCVTSPATRVVEKERGVLVQTVNNRYFVKPEGDTYLVTEE